MRYSLRLLNDSQSAEDVVQNVFLKLQSERSTIRNADSLQSWIFTVARNEAFGELRRRKGEALDEEMVWEGELPDDVLTGKSRREVVESALKALYPSFREVIILREYEQLSYDEIAQVTNTTVSSVKSRLFKARKALIEKLKPNLHNL